MANLNYVRKLYTAPETVNLMNKTYKDRCFGETMVFRRHDDFKERTFGPQEIVVNDLNVNTVWATLKENQRMICEDKATSTYISKTSMFRIQYNNLQLRDVCSR